MIPWLPGSSRLGRQGCHITRAFSIAKIATKRHSEFFWYAPRSGLVGPTDSARNAVTPLQTASAPRSRFEEVRFVKPTDEGLNGLALHAINESAEARDVTLELRLQRDGELLVASTDTRSSSLHAPRRGYARTSCWVASADKPNKRLLLRALPVRPPPKVSIAPSTITAGAVRRLTVDAKDPCGNPFDDRWPSRAREHFRV
jgi:hypothetical protein